MSSSKKVSDLVEMSRIMGRIKEFAPIHNTYKLDLSLLVEQMDVHQNDLSKCQSFYRSSIVMFFTGIEADIFYYNQFDPYNGYHDKNTFKEKLEKTFSQVCTTWKRDQLLQDYFSSNLETIFKLRNIRNDVAHPKSLVHVFKASNDDVAELKQAIEHYNAFINDLMSNFLFEMRFGSFQDMDEAIEKLFVGMIYIPKG